FRAAGQQVIEDPQLGLDYSRVVHGDQRFVYTRPLHAGDRLTVTSTIDSIKSLAGNDILSVRGEVHDEAGEHVVTSYTTLVARAVEVQTSPAKAQDIPAQAQDAQAADAQAAKDGR
ncbi:MaoC family dehydratase N-terminal domain-containing protein, partial [Streptomyces sp. MCAF7]